MDFLEIAEDLLEKGFAQATAIMAGAALENHLKSLCAKDNIPITDPNGKPLPDNNLNDALAEAGVYNRYLQEVITGWLAIKSSATFANNTEYTIDQVTNFVFGLRDFTNRYPA